MHFPVAVRYGGLQEAVAVSQVASGRWGAGAAGRSYTGAAAGGLQLGPVTCPVEQRAGHLHILSPCGPATWRAEISYQPLCVARAGLPLPDYTPSQTQPQQPLTQRRGLEVAATAAAKAPCAAAAAAPLLSLPAAARPAVCRLAALACEWGGVQEALAIAAAVSGYGPRC